MRGDLTPQDDLPRLETKKQAPSFYAATQVAPDAKARSGRDHRGIPVMLLSMLLKGGCGYENSRSANLFALGFDRPLGGK
jgi:hypothetical protein